SDEWKRIPCTASAAPAMMAAAADVPSKPPYDVLGAAGSTRLVSALPSAHAQQSIRLPKLPYAFRVDPHSDAARQSLEPAPTTMAPESLKSLFVGTRHRASLLSTLGTVSSVTPLLPAGSMTVSPTAVATR